MASSHGGFGEGPAGRPCRRRESMGILVGSFSGLPLLIGWLLCAKHDSRGQIQETDSLVALERHLPVFVLRYSIGEMQYQL